MKIINYSLNKFDKEDRKFLIDMLPYVSEFILNIETKDDIAALTIEEENETVVLEKLEFLENTLKLTDIKKGKELKTKILQSNDTQVTLNKDDIFKELIEEEHVIEIAPGVYSYSGLFLKVYTYFIKKISEFAYSTFSNIKEVEAPVLYPINEFENGQYFETFPHHVMFQTLIKNDIEVIDKFAKGGVKDKAIFNETQRPFNILRTAACVQIYPMLRDKVIAEEQSPRVFVVYGKCFRNEATNIFELARLNEFFMKEMVFVGKPEDVNNAIEKSKDLWKFWIDTFKLNYIIETANDSFFASNYKKLRLFQVLGDSKQEFKLLLPASNKYISCSSANFHRTHFTKRYNIRSEEGYCYSTCFAFGIERLTYAFLCQNGLDTSKWSKESYDEISKFIKL